MKSLNRQNMALLFQKVIWRNYLPAFVAENQESIRSSNRIAAYYTIFITLFYVIIVDLFILNHTTFTLLLLKAGIIGASILFIFISWQYNNRTSRYLIASGVIYQLTILLLYFSIIVTDRENYSYYFHNFTVILIGLNIILWIPPRVVVPMNLVCILIFGMINQNYYFRLNSEFHHVLHDTLLAVIYSTLGMVANTLINYWRFADFRDNNRLARAMEKLKTRNSEIHNLSQADELTGLYNRRFMLQQFEFAISRARRNKQQLGLMILDLDHLKKINDTYGHVQGDLTLREFAHTVKKRLRANDIAARIGGDEFCILLENIAKDDLFSLAEDIRISVANHKISLQGKKKSMSITASIGFTVFKPASNCNFDKIYHRIDGAMYESKKKGRNRTTYIEQ